MERHANLENAQRMLDQCRPKSLQEVELSSLGRELLAEARWLKARVAALEWVAQLARQLVDEPSMAYHSGAQALRQAIEDAEAR